MRKSIFSSRKVGGASAFLVVKIEASSVSVRDPAHVSLAIWVHTQCSAAHAFQTSDLVALVWLVQTVTSTCRGRGLGLRRVADSTDFPGPTSPLGCLGARLGRSLPWGDDLASQAAIPRCCAGPLSMAQGSFWLAGGCGGLRARPGRLCTSRHPPAASIPARSVLAKLRRIRYRLLRSVVVSFFWFPQF